MGIWSFIFLPHYSFLCVHTRQHMATVAVHVPQFYIWYNKRHDWQNSLWGFRISGYLLLLGNCMKLYFSHNSKDICLTGPLERDKDMLPLIKNVEKTSVYIKSTPMAGISPKLNHDWIFPRSCKDPKYDVSHIPAKDLIFLTICTVSQEVSLWHDRCQLWRQHSAQS